MVHAVQENKGTVQGAVLLFMYIFSSPLKTWQVSVKRCFNVASNTANKLCTYQQQICMWKWHLDLEYWEFRSKDCLVILSKINFCYPGNIPVATQDFQCSPVCWRCPDYCVYCRKTKQTLRSNIKMHYYGCIKVSQNYLFSFVAKYSFVCTSTQSVQENYAGSSTSGLFRHAGFHPQIRMQSSINRWEYWVQHIALKLHY